MDAPMDNLDNLLSTGADRLFAILHALRQPGRVVPDQDRWLEWFEWKQYLERRPRFNPANNLQELQNLVEKVEANIRSIVMVVHQKELTEAPGAPSMLKVNSQLLHQRQVDVGLSICAEGKYARQHSALAIGTGFFVRPDVVATAAHVLFGRDRGLHIGDLRFVHGVVMQQEGDFSEGFLVSKQQVFQPAASSLPANQYQLSFTGPDWAVVKVTPAYPEEGPYDRVLPATLKPTPNLPSGQLYSLGHGLGLSMKVSYAGKVIKDKRQKPFFECDLTILGGNSGSPVFDSDCHEVVGIYVRGIRKLQLAPNGRCLMVKNETLPWEGQECQRVLPVLEALSFLST